MTLPLETQAPESVTQPVVRISALNKHFKRENGTVVKAIDDVSLEVMPGDFVVLLGPSGCGKTTLLRSIAGLETPDSGTIEINGGSIFSSSDKLNVPPEQRRLSMVFQSYALWPHMTAFQNIAYPLQSSKGRYSRKEIRQRVEAITELTGIADITQQYPNQMSGGQQQRVALARALVGGDDLILFDEPLSNVDARVRDQLRFELIAMQRRLGFSAIFVTHDQVEAMQLATQIAVMRSGAVEQLGTPEEIYVRPATRYVADFIGTINEVPGKVTEVLPSKGSAGVPVQIDTELGPVRGFTDDSAIAVGDSAVAIWRPEQCAASPTEPELTNRWACSVTARLFVGSHIEFVLDANGTTLRLWSAEATHGDEGTTMWLGVREDCVRILADTGDQE